MARYYYLTPVLGGPGAPRYPVGAEPRLIGRSERAEIALLEPTVSREHAAIQSRAGTVHLEDLGSKHGTFVNSKRISTAALKVGDIIVFGLSLVLRLEESDRPIDDQPGFDGSTFEHTVSRVEPLPEGRVEDIPLNSRAAAEETGAAFRGDDVERLFDVHAKLRKLAAVGSLCAIRLPTILLQVQRLSDSLAKADAGVTGALEALQRSVRELVGEVPLPTPKLQPVNLLDVARRASGSVKPAAVGRDVELLVGVDPELEVLADAERLEGALTELGLNATHASPPGEAVEIHAEPDAVNIALAVIDRGAGIPEDAIGRIFDPFFTLRRDRLAQGLGLFEARQLVLSMGGRLLVDSAIGRGTTVRIVLRRA